MNKLNKKELLELIKENKEIYIGEGVYYKVIKVTDDEVDLNAKFKKQLINEGLYDFSYVGILTFKPNQKATMLTLPIYGNSKKYITKHFSTTVEQAIMKDLNDKGLSILNRFNKSNIEK